jgi:hypothetical protein
MPSRTRAHVGSSSAHDLFERTTWAEIGECFGWHVSFRCRNAYRIKKTTTGAGQSGEENSIHEWNKLRIFFGASSERAGRHRPHRTPRRWRSGHASAIILMKAINDDKRLRSSFYNASNDDKRLDHLQWMQSMILFLISEWYSFNDNNIDSSMML